MQRRFFLVPTLCLFASVMGCTMMDSMSSYMKRTLNFSRGTDYINSEDEEEEAWVTEAGHEARGDRPRETEPDPLGLRPYIMSEKARDIERNLGFD